MPIDWQGLFADPPASIDVEGVRLGDGVDALPFARFTAVEPRADGRHRVWRGSDAFDVGPDGSETQVTRERLEAELRRDGGSAWIDAVGIDVADGRVRKIWVRGEGPLGGVPIADEADIARLLGAPTGIERILGWRVYHYADRQLSVGWDPKGARVEHVALGPVDWTAPLFGRADVLAHWLEIPSWEEPADRRSPAWVRWARAVALLRAFELGKPDEFAHGHFLDGKLPERYPRVAQAIAARFPTETSPARLSWMFRWLLFYRTNAARLLNDEGLLEAGDRALLAAIEVTDEASRTISAALQPVDELLLELISPEDRRFAEADLVARFGWPELDLRALLDEEEGL